MTPMRIGGSCALAKRTGKLSVARPAAEPLISERRDVVSGIFVPPWRRFLRPRRRCFLELCGQYLARPERCQCKPALAVIGLSAMARGLRRHRDRRSGGLRRATY